MALSALCFFALALSVIIYLSAAALVRGNIYTIAGDPAGHPGYTGIGGAATSAWLHGPAGVACMGTGYCAIADTVSGVITRKFLFFCS